METYFVCFLWHRKCARIKPLSLFSIPAVFQISALMSQVSQRITDNKNGDKLVDDYD